MILKELQELIKSSFSVEEIRTVLVQLNVHQDAIPYITIDVAARELIEYFQRRGLLETLLKVLVEERPHITWPKINELKSDLQHYDFISVAVSPNPSRHFTGREKLIEDLSTRLKKGEALALHGMGGVGKTTVAAKLIELLRGFFTGGVFWGTLDTDNTRKILEAWGHSCDPDLSKGHNVETILSVETLFSTVQQLLLKRQQELGPQLFVIDTVSSTTESRKLHRPVHYLKNVLPTKSSLLLLARDRAIINLFQVNEISLPPVSPETAFAMFRNYAGPESNVVIDAEIEETKNLLEFLGYLPLAIELAAGILKEWRGAPRFNISSLFTQIMENIQEDNVDHRIKPVLLATLMSSYNNLPEDTQRVFRWLGVFSSEESIRLDSIEGVLGIKGTKIDAHLSLLNQYAMLKLELTTPGQPPEVYRYTLHQLLHLFARQELRSAGEEDAAKKAHLDYYLEFTRLHSVRHSTMHEQLETKLTNILLAIEYAHQLKSYESLREFGLLLCTKSHFLNMRGYSEVAKELLSKAEQGCMQLQDVRNRAIILGSLGLAYDYDGDVNKAVEYIEEALALAKEVGDQRGEGIWLERLGEIYQFQGQLETSCAYYDQALLLHGIRHDKKHEAIVIGCMGRIHCDRGEFHIAIEMFNQAQSRLAGNKIIDGRWLDMLGIAHRLTGNLDEAVSYFSEAIEVYSEAGNIRAIGESYGELGLVYYTLGNIQKADGYFDKALKFSLETNNRRGEAKALMNKGLSYRFRGEIEQSIGYFNQAIDICEAIKDLRNKANALAARGIAYRYLGKNQEAIRCHEEALQIRQQIGDRRGEGASLGNIGNSYLNVGQYNEAIELLEQALIISREVNDQRSIGNALDNLGRAFHHQGDAEKALLFLKESLEVSQIISQRRSEANRLGRIGNAYRKLGKLDEAIENLKKAITICEEVGDRRSLGNHSGYLGKAYLALHELDKAEKQFQIGVDICREKNDKRKEGIWYGELGIVYEERGEYDRALHHFKTALNISRKVENKHNEGICLSQIGGLYRKKYSLQEAIEYYETALSIQQKVGDRLEVANVLNRLGNAHRDIGEVVKAEAYYEQALQIYAAFGITAERIKVIGNLGSLLLALDRIEEAKEKLLVGVQLSHGMQATAGEAHVLSQLGIAHSRSNTYEQAVICGQKGLEIAEAIGQGRLKGKHHSYLGEINLHLGNLRKAEIHLVTALEIAQKIEDLGDKEWALSRLAKVYELQDNETTLHKAAETYLHALNLCLTLGDTFYEKKRRIDLSRIHHKLSNYYDMS